MNCPICYEKNGFHGEAAHAQLVTVPMRLLKSPGWHKKKLLR